MVRKLLSFIYLGAFALSACSLDAGKGGISRISIVVPGAQKSQALGATYDFSKACFAVNVTAKDIASKTPGTCDVPIGVFAGFAGGGEKLELSIAKGVSRKLELFAFLKTTAETSCPRLDGFGTIARSRIARIGQVSSFDANSAEVTIELEVGAPAAGETLLTQYALPESCAPKVPAGGSTGVVLGHSRLSGGAFIMSGTVHHSTNEAHLTGGSFKMQLSRQPSSGR